MNQHLESDSKQELNISVFYDYVNANSSAVYKQWQQAQQSYYNLNATSPSNQPALPLSMYFTIDPQTLVSIITQMMT